MRTHLPEKDRLGLEGNNVLKIFFYFLYIDMFDTKSDHFSPKIKPYVHGNKKSMQYYKIVSNRELTHEDGSI